MGAKVSEMARRAVAKQQNKEKAARDPPKASEKATDRTTMRDKVKAAASEDDIEPGSGKGSGRGDTDEDQMNGLNEDATGNGSATKVNKGKRKLRSARQVEEAQQEAEEEDVPAEAADDDGASRKKPKAGRRKAEVAADAENSSESASENLSSSSSDATLSDEEDDQSDSDASSEEEEEERPVHKSRSKKKAPKKKLSLKLGRQKSKSRSHGESRLLNLLEALLENGGRKNKKGKDDSEAIDDKALRKAVVQRCRDKLCKKSFYPTAQQIEHEAKAMAKEEAGTDKAPPELQRKIARLMRSAMTKQIRGLTATSIKKSVKQHYVDVSEADIANMLESAAYRTAGGESYGAKAFMGVLNDVFGKDEKKGKLQLAASQVAFVELGFPKDNNAGKVDQEAYEDFRKKAAEGIDEAGLVVKGLSAKKSAA